MTYGIKRPESHHARLVPSDVAKERPYVLPEEFVRRGGLAVNSIYGKLIPSPETKIQEALDRIGERLERIEEEFRLNNRRFVFVRGECLVICENVDFDPYSKVPKEPRVYQATVATGFSPITRGETVRLFIEPMVVCRVTLFEAPEPFLIRSITVGVNSQILSYDAATRKVVCQRPVCPGERITIDVEWPA